MTFERHEPCDEPWCDICAAAAEMRAIDPHPRAAAERRIVAQLSEAMLAKLAQRREHGEWRNLTARQLFAMSHNEICELADALYAWSPKVNNTQASRAAVIAEAADVANYLAMLVDVLSKGGDS